MAFQPVTTDSNVKQAAASLVRERFLLVEDYDRMVETALEKGTELWKNSR